MLFLAVCGEPCLEWDQSARSVADRKVLGQACESRTQYKDPASVASATPDALVDPLPSFSPTPLPGPFAPKSSPEASIRHVVPAQVCAVALVARLWRSVSETKFAGSCSLVAALALAPWSSALLLATPVDWHSSSVVNISWSSVASDPPFSFELVNTDAFHDTFALANNVNPTLNFLSFELGVVPVGYVLCFL